MKTIEQWRKENKVPTDRTLTKRIVEGSYGANWYTDSAQAIAERFQDHNRLFASILAATSPRNSVRSNTIFALRAYRSITQYYVVYRADDPKYGITHKLAVNNLERIMNGEQIGGRKVSNFVEALCGNGQAVVVDVHMCKTFNLKRTSPTKLDYDYIEVIIKKLASKLNMQPAECQAALWCYSVTKQGRKVVSYADTLKQLEFSLDK